MPALWASPLLSISANATLTQICLGEDAHHPSLALASTMPYERRRTPSSPFLPKQEAQRRPILGTSLFLSEARKHTRLVDLIKAGTAVVGWRGRAWTVGAGQGGAYEQQLGKQEAEQGRC